MSEQITCYSYLNKFNTLLFTCVTVISLSFLLISCSDTTLNTAENNTVTDDITASEQISYSKVLSSGNYLATRSTANNSRGGPAHQAENQSFAGPIFGLATAPNGDILVADAGAGIATAEKVTDIPLPGVSDMSPIGRGAMWATKGLTANPGEDTGQALYRVSKGENRVIADLFAFEQEHNPDGADLIDSNPFDVHSLGGQSALVADAAGNDLLKIDNRGNIDVLAVFPVEPVSTANIKSLVGCPDSGAELCALPPMIPTQAVPTSIAEGPDGSYYVGELKGFPAPAGESNIWRISPGASGAMCGTDAGCVKAFDGGFTSIIDMAFDNKGNLYVAELDENSWFAVEVGAGAGGTINKCDPVAGTCTEVASGIPMLTSITFGKDGTLWATRNSLIPGTAEVFKVE